MDFIIQYILSLYSDCQHVEQNYEMPSFQQINNNFQTFDSNISNNNNINQLVKDNSVLWNCFVNSQQLQQHNYRITDNNSNYFQSSPVFVSLINNTHLNQAQQTQKQLITNVDSKEELHENRGKELYRDNHVIVREQSIDYSLENSSYYKMTMNEEYNKNDTTVSCNQRRLSSVSNYDKSSGENQSKNITVISPINSKLISSVIEGVNNDQLKDMRTRNLLKRKNVTTSESNSSFTNFILSTPTDIGKKIQEHEALVGKRGRGRPKTKITTNKNNKKIKH